jgi:hypothetical protein
MKRVHQVARFPDKGVNIGRKVFENSSVDSFFFDRPPLFEPLVGLQLAFLPREQTQDRMLDLM